MDAEYTIARLLLPDRTGETGGLRHRRRGRRDRPALTDAVTAAQKTPEGRARIALAAACLNLPAWAPGEDRPAARDWAEQQEQQYDWFAQGILNRVEPARYDIEKSVGGNNSWNRGVDYARVLSTSQHAPQVRALYRAAGLDLRADLSEPDRGREDHRRPAAVAAGERTSSAGQGPRRAAAQHAHHRRQPRPGGAGETASPPGPRLR